MTRSEYKVGMRVYDQVKRITGNVSFVGFLGSETHCLIEGESLEIVAIESLQECRCGTCARLMGDRCIECKNESLWIRYIHTKEKV